MAQGIHFDDFNLTQHAYPKTEACYQSKLAVTMWSYDLAHALRRLSITANSLHLGTFVGIKMVRQGIGTLQMSLSDGAKPVVRLALDEDVRAITGQYVDRFREARTPESVYNESLRRRLYEATEQMLAGYLVELKTRKDA